LGLVWRSALERSAGSLARPLLSQSLIYGEVEFHSFAKVLRKISMPKGAVFCDLGSGTGKVRSLAAPCGDRRVPHGGDASVVARLWVQAVFVARFLHDFDQCRGIEILDGLAAAGEAVLSAYAEGPFKEYLSVAEGVGLTRGSILEEDWSNGDLVRYTNNQVVVCVFVIRVITRSPYDPCVWRLGLRQLDVL
jgi:hypothetical protein